MPAFSLNSSSERNGKKKYLLELQLTSERSLTVTICPLFEINIFQIKIHLMQEVYLNTEISGQKNKGLSDPNILHHKL